MTALILGFGIILLGEGERNTRLVTACNDLNDVFMQMYGDDPEVITDWCVLSAEVRSLLQTGRRSSVHSRWYFWLLMYATSSMQ